MTQPDVPQHEHPSRKRLLQTTGVALAVALAVLVVAILPAEYGIDPTGAGALLGLTGLGGSGGSAGSGGDLPPLFEGRWVPQETSLTDSAGNVGPGESATAQWRFDGENLTRMRVAIHWSTAGGEALVEASLVAPDGSENEPRLDLVGADDGASNLTFEWRDLSPSRQTFAVDAARAEAELLLYEPADPTAQGNWTLRVVQRDGAPVSWDAQVFAETFRLEVLDAAAERPRQDTVVLRVPAGNGLEYKFNVTEGARLHYEWSARFGPGGDASLEYDLHGDQDRPGTSESHKVATAFADTGILTAPFSGRHGWYWYNPGEEDAFVTLTTTGTYGIIGRIGS